MKNLRLVIKTGIVLGMCLCLHASHVFAAEEALCAEVKIEILQELTIERQGFEAIMKITNSLESYAIDDIEVTVNFADANGQTVMATSNTQSTTALFFIRVDDSSGVNDLQTGDDGAITNGTIAPKSVGEMRWLIIPTERAATQPSGVLYLVGATLTYQYGGKVETVNVAPDTIVVKPQPKITLDYFLTEEVLGDDAFTPMVEPPVPYTLGVRVVNNGLGVADSVKIESAQPRIVENEQQLLVDFRILESYLKDFPAEKSLLLDFGDIPSKSISTGRWVMQSTLSGKFTSIDTRFSHADELGGALTSLIEATNSYLLVKDVMVDLAGRDTVRDYLAKVETGTGLRLFESENTGASLGSCLACSDVFPVVANLTGSGVLQRTLTPVDAQAGFNLMKVPDPFEGTLALKDVIRNDGRKLNLQNAWISKERNADKIHFDYFINILDVNPTGSYTLMFGSLADLPQAPFIGFIEPRTTYEGEQVGFLVLSSDPNGTEPVVTAENMPSGARLNKTGPNTYAFSWFTQTGQAGHYVVTFTANDGALTFSRDVDITVHPANDKDGDGMDDAWEQEHFGDTSHDGSADTDGDGITDAEEFDLGTDPNVREVVPSVPAIASPLFNTAVLQGGNAAGLYPAVAVFNSKHPANMAVWYEFEFFADLAMTQQVAWVDGIEEGSGSVSGQTRFQPAAVQLSEGQSFEDNHTYVWRARAYTTGDQGQRLYSDWVTSRFFINTANDAPSQPQLSSPANSMTVTTLKPLLVTGNATDLDGDSLTYGFQLFMQGGETPIASIQGLNPQTSGQTSWQVPISLEEDSRYEWQVTVTDDKGNATASDRFMFLVSLANGSPVGLAILSPVDGSEVQQLDTGNTVWLTLLNGADSEQDPLYYTVEVDVTDTFDSPELVRFESIAEGNNALQPGTTRVAFSNAIEDRHYFWRARVSDGESDSPWQTAGFTVNSENSAPSVPTVVSPGHESVIETLQPTLTVAPSIDPEGQLINYRFELYRDAAMSELVGSFVNAEPFWTLESALEDNRPYYWRVRSEDALSASSAWRVASFFTNNNGIDDAPAINFVAPDQNLVVSGGLVTVEWQDHDPDSSATIQIVAVDGLGGLTTLASGIEEDADGVSDSAVIDVSVLTPGSYHLRLVITDQTQTVSVDSLYTLQRLPDSNAITTMVSGFQLDEAGVNDVAVDVYLAQPLTGTETLTVHLGLNDSGEARIVSAGGVPGMNYLQFTAADWQQSQRIVLRGVDDCLVDGNQSVNLLFTSIVSDAPAYAGSSLDAIALPVIDNEYTGQTLFICDYEIVSQSPVAGENSLDVSLQPRLQNRGVSLESAEAGLVILSGTEPPQQLMSSAQVTFGPNGNGLSPFSAETLTVRVAAATGLDTAKFGWQIIPGTNAPTTQGSAGNDTITGTEGNDVIFGLGGHDTIHGGGGEDRIIGGAGSDTLYGETGNDIFEIQGTDTGIDLFNGGSGYDRIMGGYSNDTIRVSQFTGENTVEEIDGGAGSNVISGSSGNDVLDFSQALLKNIALIEGLQGHDTITGSAANDTIAGNEGNDTLRGGAGNDTFLIFGTTDGTDTTYGDDGFDILLGSSGNDAFSLGTFTGLATVERIDGQGGTNVIVGTTANNVLDFSNTELVNIASIDGGIGHDTITGSPYADVIIGGAGNDILNGNAGNDIFQLVSGDNGVDTYNGGAGIDTLKGTVDSDVFSTSALSSNQSIEVIDGDGGFNTIAGSANNDTLDLSTITLISINEIQGLAGHDTIRGTANADTIVAGSGNDVLYGNGGDDRFVISSDDTGTDTYYGGEGSDTIDGQSAPGNIRLGVMGPANSIETIVSGTPAKAIEGDASNNVLDFTGITLVNISQILGGNGHDTLKGTEQNDTLVGGVGNDTLYGNGGNDTFVVSADDTGVDTYYGGDGTDTIDVSAVTGTLNFSAFSTSNSIEIINAGSTPRTITGDTGNNTLDFSAITLMNITRIEGGAGHDSIKATNQADTLVGGSGNDALYGLGGDDTFVISADDTGVDVYYGGDGTDTIDGTLAQGGIRLSAMVMATHGIERIDAGSPAKPIIGDASNNTLDFTGVTLLAITEIQGGNGHDVIKGNDDQNVLVGGAGNDQLYGNGGNDTFVISADDTGVDTYFGGDGTDTIDGSLNTVIRLSALAASQGIEVISGGSSVKSIEGDAGNNSLDFRTVTLENIASINGLGGHDTVQGTPLADVIIGGMGNDQLYGNGGDDTFVISADDTGVDTYYGGEGNDTIDGSQSLGSIKLSAMSSVNSIELIDAGSMPRVIEGNTSNNVLDFRATALQGISEIQGMDGHDTLYGTALDDTLVGGIGNDQLFGEAGNDVYRFAISSGVDTVTDLAGINDIGIDVSDAHGLWVTVSGNNIIIQRLNTADKVTLVSAVTNPAAYRIALSNGSYLTGSQLVTYAQQLTAMATVVNGQVTLTAELQQQWDSLITQSWQ